MNAMRAEKIAMQRTMITHICWVRVHLRLAIAVWMVACDEFASRSWRLAVNCERRTANCELERLLRRKTSTYRSVPSRSLRAHRRAEAADRPGASLASRARQTRPRGADDCRGRGGGVESGKTRRGRSGDGDDSHLLADPRRSAGDGRRADAARRAGAASRSG